MIEFVEKKLGCGHILKLAPCAQEGEGNELPHQKSLEVLEHYEELFRIHPLSPKKVFEIGISRGGSLALWSEIFPTAQVVGMDPVPYLIVPNCERHYEEEGRSIRVMKGRMPSEEPFQYGPFDLIIDDGSHGLKDVQETFKLAWPKLVPGGLYVIEDWSHIDMALKPLITDIADLQVGYWPADKAPDTTVASFHVWRRIIAVVKK